MIVCCVSAFESTLVLLCSYVPTSMSSQGPIPLASLASIAESDVQSTYIVQLVVPITDLSSTVTSWVDYPPLSQQCSADLRRKLTMEVS